ncbi:MAG: hypothetical protein RL536_267, partial [Candidatus Parcubacteria bacterium]
MIHMNIIYKKTLPILTFFLITIFTLTFFGTNVKAYPSGFVVTAVSQNSISLAWNEDTANPIYRISRTTDPNAGVSYITGYFDGSITYVD